MSRQPRFEICRDFDGWWARFRAANGRIVWVTETYRRRDHATRAITLITNQSLSRGSDGVYCAWLYDEPTEVREVDERD